MRSCRFDLLTAHPCQHAGTISSLGTVPQIFLLCEERCDCTGTDFLPLQLVSLLLAGAARYTLSCRIHTGNSGTPHAARASISLG